MIDNRKETAFAIINSFINHNKSVILHELSFVELGSATKDIIIIIHNQLDVTRNCIESIQKHTNNYKLYLWDNGSNEETKLYLQSIADTHSQEVVLHRNEQNIGFIKPNNVLVEKGSNDYVILLNSDTVVFEGWDTALIGYLKANPNVGQIGYMGGLLDENGKGGRAVWGKNLDYIMGFCSCFSRELYNEIGLFSEEFEFAYCEDSDFSLKVQKEGLELYALHLMLVHHLENKTIKEVSKNSEIDLRGNFAKNHQKLKLKWQDYLEKQRVDLRKIDLENL